ncbi:MAG: hypothetical protein LQ351_001352 [Letrouitia transgressa]|nr:MAG: hypothetical protein LQ351_001352 [Letrouitia transgressa]
MRTIALLAHAMLGVVPLIFAVASAFPHFHEPRIQLAARDDISSLENEVSSPNVRTDSLILAENGAATNQSSRPPGRKLIEYPISVHSSSGYVESTEGIKLYGLPISVASYRSLLQGAIDDLAGHDRLQQLSRYTFNSSDWSFNVLAVNTTVNYAIVDTVAKRFLALLPPSAEGLVNTRVATISRNNEPVADVMVIPAYEVPAVEALTAVSNQSAVPVDLDPATGQVSYTTVLANGSSTALQPFDEALWSRFVQNVTNAVDEGHSKAKAKAKAKPKRTAELALLDMVHNVAVPGTAYGFNVRIWRDPTTGALRRAPVLFFRAAIRAALNYLVHELDARRAIGDLFDPDRLVDDFGMFAEITSGAVPLGVSTAVFRMMTSVQDAQMQPLRLHADMWLRLALTLLQRFANLPPNALFPEIVADLLGPDPVTGQVGVIGGMVFVVGGGNAIVHDELRH